MVSPPHALDVYEAVALRETLASGLPPPMHRGGPQSLGRASRLREPELPLPEAWGAACERRARSPREFPDKVPSPALQSTNTALKAPVSDADCGCSRSPDFSRSGVPRRQRMLRYRIA